jgi:hypothetical protein
MKANYEVHPVAALFPMLERSSDDYHRLFCDIDVHGQVEPIVLDGDVLLDGRNRLAVMEALDREPKFVQWRDLVRTLPPDTDPGEWIVGKNLSRRHLTADQALAIAAQFHDLNCERLAAEAKASTEFKKGVCPNPDGRAGKQVTPDSGSPVPPKPKRDRKQSHANSRAGQLAAKAKTTRHKAEQIIKVTKAVDAKVLPADTLPKIASGETTIKEVLKVVEKAPDLPPEPPPTEEPAKPAKKRKPGELRELVIRKLIKLLASFAASEQAQVKAYLIEQLQ